MKYSDLERLARRRLNLAENWKVYQWECLPKSSMQTTHFQVTGAVCDAVYSKGPRKGETNWSKRDRKTEMQFVCSVAEAEAFCLEWEQETGKCHKCEGSGQTFAGWNPTDGNKYRTCQRCNGSGEMKGADQ